MTTICRFTHDVDKNECYIGNRFKFISADSKLGVPSYYLNRLCRIKHISKGKEVIFFFFDEPLIDRKIATSTFNKVCHKHLE
jgi:hypothetical protein